CAPQTPPRGSHRPARGRYAPRVPTEAWQIFAEAAPALDPGETVTQAVYAATLHAPQEPAPAPDPLVVTLPELPILTMGYVEGAQRTPGPPGKGDADFEV